MNSKNIVAILLWLLINILFSSYSALNNISITLSLFVMVASFIALIFSVKIKDVSSFTIYLLSLYLPFYAFIRGYLLVNNVGLLSNYINHLRDFIIITTFLLILIRRNSLNKLNVTILSANHKKLLLGILFLILNYVYGFIISSMRGYPTLGLKGVHLNLIPIMLIYIVYNSKVITVDFISKYIKALLYIGIVVSIIGFYFYFYKPPYFGVIFAAFRQQDEVINHLMNYVRLVSVFLSPNVFGSFMAIISIIAFNEILNKKENTPLITCIVAFVLSIISLGFSLSRGAWMFSFFGLIVTYFLNRKKVKFQSKILVFLSLAIITITVVLLDNNLLVDRLSTIFSFSNESSYGRIQHGIETLSHISNNISGLGLGVGGINMALYSPISDSTGVGVIDGFYIKTIIETGIIGLFLFPAFIILSLSALINLSRKEDDDKRKYHILTGSILIGALFQSIGSNVFDFVQISPLIWIFYGFSLKLIRISKTEKVL